MIRQIILVLFSILLLPACNRRSDRFDTTQAGYGVRFEDRGSIALSYYPLAQAYAWFDQSVDNHSVAYLAKYGVTAEMVRGTAFGTKMYLYDTWRHEDGFTGRATFIAGHVAAIEVCLYRGAHVETGFVPPSSVNGYAVPSWTWLYRPESGRTYYGFIDEVAGLYPALGHELGHAIYGPEFEHTWWPPTVARVVSQNPRWASSPTGGCYLID